jgi:hypothetical protein
LSARRPHRHLACFINPALEFVTVQPAWIIQAARLEFEIERAYCAMVERPHPQLAEVSDHLNGRGVVRG